MKKPFGVVLGFVLIGSTLGAMQPALASGDARPGRAQLSAMTAPTGSGRYIVVMKRSASASLVAARQAREGGFHPRFVYSHALDGYAATLSPAQLAGVEADPNTRSVRPDATFTSASLSPPQYVPTDIPRTGADQSSTASGDGTGSVNVNVAVLDSGIDLKNGDVNVVGGKNCIGNRGSNHGYSDNFGHGTAVAGVLGAEDNDGGTVGVAPGANLYSIKVLNGKGIGSVSSVLCGIDWVTATRTDSNPNNDIAVANLSILAPGSDDGNCGNTNQDAVHMAICASTASGVTYVVAAGNDGVDEAGTIPAAYPQVLSATAMTDTDGMPGGVGGTDLCGDSLSTYPDDTPASFSNFATTSSDEAHTVAAPGVCDLSLYYNPHHPRLHGNIGGFYGTSFASPMVAGAVALCISSGPCVGLTPAQIVAKIVGDAAAFTTGNPSYGFAGDPLNSPIPGRYYGFLIRVSLY